MSETNNDLETNILEKYIVIKEIVKNEIDENGHQTTLKIIICKEPISEKIKDSKRKFYLENKEKLNKMNIEYVKERSKNEPEFLERIREIKRNSYHRQKEKKMKEKKDKEETKL